MHTQHLVKKCEHGVVVAQCKCFGPKTEVIVACPPTCSTQVESDASEEVRVSVPYEITPLSDKMTIELDTRFTYHSPTADQVPRFTDIRREARLFAQLIAELCPESREQSLALTHLEQAVMYANAAIARRE